MLTPDTHQKLPKNSRQYTKANKLSSDEHVLKSTNDPYNYALKNCGNKQNIEFQDAFVEMQKRNGNKLRACYYMV